MLIYYVKSDKNIFRVDNFSIIFTLFLAGIFSGLMCVSKVYASNPTLVSPVIQSTLVSTTLFFSFIFSKLLLDKKTSYDYVYLSFSVTALIGSILLPLTYGLIYLNAGVTDCGFCFIYLVLYAGVYFLFYKKNILFKQILSRLRTK